MNDVMLSVTFFMLYKSGFALEKSEIIHSKKSL
jgi:hypothetical protein